MVSRTALVLLALLTASTAVAQTANVPSNFAVERFRLTPSRTGLLDTEWGAVPKGFVWDVGLWVGWAKNPLVLYRLADGTRVGPLLEDRVGAGLVGAVSFLDRFQIGLELPLVLGNGRPSSIGEATIGTLPSIAGPGAGDLRVMPKVGILRHEDHVVDLAVLANVLIPTGGAARYVGSSGFVIQPEVAVSRPFGNLRTAFNLGAAFRTEQQQALNLNIGHELNARLAGAWRFNQTNPDGLPLELGLTLLGGFGLERPFQNANQAVGEAKVYGAWDVTSWMQLFAGGGLGLTRGWGVPDWRIFGGLRFGPAAQPTKPVGPVTEPDADGDGLVDSLDQCPKEAGPRDRQGCPLRDTDGDGVLDADDACPTVKGLKENKGCPDADRDGDGIADRLDRCPGEKEDIDTFEDTDGCPDPDNDADGVLDTADMCPLVKGAPENKGCPDVDTDGDGLVDRLDNCPREAGDAKNNGCKLKQLVVIESGKLRILDTVYFKLNQAIIETRSYPLLDNVKAIMAEHPEIERLRVEGHTDNQGNDASNLKLSQARAEAVKAYLVKKGVQAGRLEPVGYGEARPIADNRTVPGRAKNRRVEFNIVGGAEGIEKRETGPSTDTFEKKN
ncbi:MAG: OmpA family protein [Myxococcales bacterium]|nr:OmpA family protein [Myxococcales bacterium]